MTLCLPQRSALKEGSFGNNLTDHLPVRFGMKLLDTADKPLQGLPPLWAYLHKDFEAEVDNILKKSKPGQDDPWDNLKDVKAAMLQAASTLVHR